MNAIITNAMRKMGNQATGRVGGQRVVATSRSSST